MISRQKLKPEVTTLIIRCHSLLWIASTPCCVETIWIKSIHLGEQFHCPTDRLLLEVITERPIAEHLEECVVVGIAAHILKVVVLATSTNALLGVNGTRVVARSLAKEHILELVHACVREEQGGILEWDRRT